MNYYAMKYYNPSNKFSGYFSDDDDDFFTSYQLINQYYDYNSYTDWFENHPKYKKRSLEEYEIKQLFNVVVTYVQDNIDWYFKIDKFDDNTVTVIFVNFHPCNKSHMFCETKEMSHEEFYEYVKQIKSFSLSITSWEYIMTRISKFATWPSFIAKVDNRHIIPLLCKCNKRLGVFELFGKSIGTLCSWKFTHPSDYHIVFYGGTYDIISEQRYEEIKKFYPEIEYQISNDENFNSQTLLHKILREFKSNISFYCNLKNFFQVRHSPFFKAKMLKPYTISFHHILYKINVFKNDICSQTYTNYHRDIDESLFNVFEDICDKMINIKIISNEEK